MAKEKELTRQRDALNAGRRRALTVEIGKRYVFEGAEGRAGLLGLFEDRGQLLMLKHRLMWLFGEGRACLLKWRRRLWQACTWPWREA